jgi:hypothetical protein
MSVALLWLDSTLTTWADSDWRPPLGRVQSGFTAQRSLKCSGVKESAPGSRGEGAEGSCSARRSCSPPNTHTDARERGRNETASTPPASKLSWKLRDSIASGSASARAPPLNGAEQKGRRTMTRRLVIALACAAVAMGGCATLLGTNDHASSTEGSAAPNTFPRPLPPNDFGSSAPHSFGSQGP